MKNKTPLAMIELTVMLLVLALAAALCLRAFAWADRRSEENSCRDTAVVELQSAAECLRHCGGDFEAAVSLYGGAWDGSCWRIDCGAFEIRAIPRASGQQYLGSAVLEAEYQGRVLASLQVCWQEVA